MFTPKKFKFRKQRKGQNYNKAAAPYSINNLNQGVACIVALESGRLTTNQIHACRQTINKLIKRQGKLILNLVTDTPISKKPNEIRMGKGKGNVDHYVKKVPLGTRLFEIECNNKALAEKALKTIQIKLPLNTRILLEF